jgi:hypothetical protein
VVGAEGAAAAVAGVFEEGAGRLIVTQFVQRFAQPLGGGEGVGVVGAEGAAAAVAGVFEEGAGRLIVTQVAQRGGQPLGGGEGVGVVWCRRRRRSLRRCPGERGELAGLAVGAVDGASGGPVSPDGEVGDDVA